ncbi:MAG: peptide-methionine (S)-S-oxide reductase MsrA [Chitinophagales bacterium]|nr:peptide-methionine (S)-S-oxide reductase MsrA [Chitinophagales bacterium]
MKNNEMKTDIKLVAVENFPEGKEAATFAGGCFWCTEAVFEEVIGVEKVISGYTGGKRENPTYEQVCSGATGHAEAIQIIYDPTKADYKTLLDIFMRTHEPTELNKQGNDVGTQYRSAIYYHNDAQKQIAESYINEHNADNLFGGKIVTEVTPFTKFYEAEGYHQDYFANNPDQPYCVYVVAKKVDKFEHLFPEKVKKEYLN